MTVLGKIPFRLFCAALLMCMFSFISSSGSGDVINDTGTLVTWYKPPVKIKWQIQLQGKLSPDYSADLYDYDLFDTPVTTIRQLHAHGKHVICYFSAGSSENWRPDFGKFLPSDMGKSMSGWPGEKWLDIRSQNVRTVMQARMDLAKQNGCDGVDPDNVDGYSNKTGLPLTAADQVDYDRFLADEAHKRGLAVGLKNNVDQIKSLVSLFDFAVNEQCFRYDECSKITPFITAGKPVLNIEYNKKYVNSTTQRATLCKMSLGMKFSTLVLPQVLNNKFYYSCL